MKKNKLHIRIVLCLCILFLYGCKADVEKNDMARLRVAISSEPPTLDWNLATDNVSFTVINNIMEGLTRFDEKMNVIPSVASRWESFSSFTRYRFYINEKSRWSDGRPVTARDFEYSWKRLLAPETAAEYAYFLYDIKNAYLYNAGKLKNSDSVGVKAISDTVLEVTLERPLVFFPALTAFMVTFPLRQDIVEKYGERWTEPDNMIGNGPYHLKKWEHDYKIELSENPHYKGAKPDFKEVDIFMVSEPNTALLLYETGALDIVELPSIAVSKLKTNPEYKRYSILRGYYYGFNTKKAPFNNSIVRRALVSAIDRNEIVNSLNSGDIPVTSWIPQGMFAENNAIGISFNPEKGRKLLAEAGYAGGKKFPELTIAFNSSEENRIVAENIQSQLSRNLGIHANLDNLEWKVYLTKLKNDCPDIFRLGWGADFPDPDNFMRIFTSSSGNNNTGWGNEEYDRLITEGAETGDNGKRLEIYNKAQKILCEEDVPIIPLFVGSKNILVKPYITGTSFSPLDTYYYNMFRRKK
ncbi:MAG: peptide ABC transporter substrate-binding protein [Candidatus Schekmanbacteria bacterium]|nr:peptide ABC transporter substrate-binding protein [Candidatus Schekmanbacteria bacterium]